MKTTIVITLHKYNYKLHAEYAPLFAIYLSAITHVETKLYKFVPIKKKLDTKD